LGFILAGCASIPEQRPASLTRADKLLESSVEQGYSDALTLQAEALAIYQSNDDLRGRWRANSLLAASYIKLGKIERAGAHAQVSYKLSQVLDDRETCYASSLQLGALFSDIELLEQALGCAEGQVQEALVLAFLERYDDIPLSLAAAEPGKDSADIALILYRLGKFRGERSLVLLALTHFRAAGNTVGVIDSLYLAARLSKDPDQQIELAHRALLAARAAGASVQAQSISNWLSSDREMLHAAGKDFSD